MASVLTIGGTVVNRYLARVIINRMSHSLDGADELEFTELATAPPGSYGCEQRVTLDVDGNREFDGWIFSRHYGALGVDCPWVGYRCMGLVYGVNLIAVTASDGAGSMRFNLPTTDQNYQSTQAGRSVGQILTQVFSQHSTQFSAIGVNTDPTTASQLGALIVVPREPVYIAGNNIWAQCQQLMQQWYGSKYALYITAGGVIRCQDTTTLLAVSINLDTDPVILGSLNEDTSECFTQVCIRGAANVEPYYASLLDGTLIDPNNPSPENSWTIQDFNTPKGGASTGTISSQTSTTVNVSSDVATETWGVNYWSGISAEIAVINPAITGPADYTGSDWRRITANTALTAGGTSTITVDRPFTTTGYTKYKIRGTPPGKSECYRKYTFKNRTVAQHLLPMFPHSVEWSPSQGAVMATLTPQAVIVSTPTLASSTIQWSLPFEVIPYDGTTDGFIRFYVPTVSVVGGNGGMNGSNLIAGGSAVIRPADIIVLVPYSRGALQAIEPLSGGTPTYGGTAYTRFGVQRTLYRDYPDWLDVHDTTQLQTLAQHILDTVSNAVQEGSFTYLGKYTTALYSGSWPFAVNVVKSSGTTGFETMAAPARSISLEWPQAGATPWVTQVNFSTRRQQYSGDRLYLHPMYAIGGGQFAQSGQTIGGGVPLMVSRGITPATLGLDQSAMELTGYTGMSELMAGLSASLLGGAPDRAEQAKGGGEFTEEDYSGFRFTERDRRRQRQGRRREAAAAEKAEAQFGEEGYEKFRLPAAQRRKAALRRQGEKDVGTIWGEGGGGMAPEAQQERRQRAAAIQAGGGLRAARGLQDQEMEAEGGGGMGSIADEAQVSRRLETQRRRRRGSLRSRRFGEGILPEDET